VRDLVNIWRADNDDLVVVLNLDRDEGRETSVLLRVEGDGVWNTVVIEVGRETVFVLDHGFGAGGKLWEGADEHWEQRSEEMHF
jgi:hypothetical protein